MAAKEGTSEPEGELSASEDNRPDRSALVERLVAQGASRLTAERTVAIQQGDDAPGRARRRSQARR